MNEKMNEIKRKLYNLFSSNYKPDYVAELLQLDRNLVENHYKEYLKLREEINKILKNF